MADILRITTPLISKHAAQLQQKQPNPGEVFSLHDLTRVVKPNPQSELLMQNNTVTDQASNIPVDIELFGNPDVMSGYINSVILLMEVVGLLPLNNKTATSEISQMFDALFVQPDEVVPELLRQESASSVFKGGFFDFLRSVIRNDSDPEKVHTALRLLKAINERLEGRQALNSVANNLGYLADALAPSKELSEKLEDLAMGFRSADAPEMLASLKADIVALFREIEGSILYNEKIEKLLPMILYNLSRYNQNQDAVAQLGEQFAGFLDNEQTKLEFLSLLKSVLVPGSQSSEKGNLPNQQVSAATDIDINFEKLPEEQIYDSKVMDTLIKLIGKEYESETIADASKSKLDKIINSLLSSPSNFTPLLHYILPLQYENIRSYAEIWINPNGNEETEVSGDNSAGSDMHFLIVFDITDVGRFEAELFVRDRTIDFLLLCPEEHLKVFSNLDTAFRRSIQNSGYRFRSVKINKLERNRSLIEVFTTLPYRRMGIDITI